MLETKTLQADLCVVGGGVAGICAAISAARNGAKVVLMHERPVLGGNASSEIRMWICGARGENNRETGILEEISLQNHFRNPTKNFYLWDTVLLEFVRREPNITLLLNCTCMDAGVEAGEFAHGRDRKIQWVKGYQMTTQRFYRVEAKLFADCSGDSVLAPLTGAAFRLGRECAEEFGEQTHVKTPDDLTMGMSCLIQGRETTEPVPFTPPAWSTKLNSEHFRFRRPLMDTEEENFWYLELGGDRDTIGQTEEIAEELVPLALGTWDYVKNSGEFDVDNWELEFLGFLPGKRESRRMVGQYIITERDITGDREFPDTVAFGGWPLDDHFPDGFYHKGTPNTDFQTPAPYRIPYRALYSANVDNLFFAGRNISMTHMAMSSVRVMATCGLMGQAVGTAAAIAAKYGLAPHGVYEEKLEALQDALMDADCFLPGFRRKVSALCAGTPVLGGNDSLKNGEDRQNRVYGNKPCGVTLENGTALEYRFSQAERVEKLHITFDSDLNRLTLDGGPCERTHNTRANVRLGAPRLRVPETLCKGYRLELTEEDGSVTVTEESRNLLRAVEVPVGRAVRGIRLVPLTNWGGTDTTNVVSFDFV